jgi:predicted RNase H-like nuclease (RuvC/YqgF family)
VKSAKQSAGKSQHFARRPRGEHPGRRARGRAARGAVQAEAVSSELEAARKEIADARAQLEQARTDAARMEQVLVDKDRAVAARDERIRTLQLEIQQRPGAIVP